MKQLNYHITEKEFTRQVETLLNLYHWHFYHVYEQKFYAHRSANGFPDYVAVRDGRVLFIELKSENGLLTTDQITWLAELRQCPDIEVWLWRPSNWNQIEVVLR